MILKPNILLNNRYELTERIGSGGFSVVWKATDTHRGRAQVAIKIFVPDKGMDTEGLSVFKDEYELTLTLNDGRLVKNTDFFIEDYSPCLVMPFMPNGSLYGKIARHGVLAEEEVAKVLYQIAGGLNYLHTQARPVLHLDIKPDNILIDYSGDYRLADFGISSRTRSSLLRASNQKGETLAYSTPERALNKRVGTYSDIFSLGITIFELCTGDVPWNAEGGKALVLGLPMPELPKSYSRRLNCIMQQCLSLEPENRPIASQLEHWAAGFLDNKFWDIPENNKNQKQPVTAKGTEPIKPKITLNVDNGAQPNSSNFPPELKGWNWGAFFFNWIWGLSNGVYLGLLCLIPYFNFIWAFVMGANGNKWAWEKKKWESVAHFKMVQRKWAIAGFIVYGSIILIIILSLIVVVLEENSYGNSESYETVSVESNNSSTSFQNVYAEDVSIKIPTYMTQMTFNEEAILQYGNENMLVFFQVVRSSIYTNSFQDFRDLIIYNLKTELKNYSYKKTDWYDYNFSNSEAYSATGLDEDSTPLKFLCGFVEINTDLYLIMFWTSGAKNVYTGKYDEDFMSSLKSFEYTGN